MSKYEPLRAFLAAQSRAPIRMSVKQVESVLGFPLPRSAKLYNAWWSNSDNSHVQASAWLAAGFETATVDLDAGKVTFVPTPTDPDAAAAPAVRTGRHPAFGALKGMITLLPDVDYTEPADPDWGKVYED